MEKELLDLTPKRYLCPYCGEWHEWDKKMHLGWYDDRDCRAQFKCSSVPPGFNAGDYRIYFYDGCLRYSTQRICMKANQEMVGSIPISSIFEDPDRPIVTFDVEFTSNKMVGSDECDECVFKNNCNCVKLGDKGDNRHMTIKLGFEFEQSDCDEFAKFAQQELEQTQPVQKEIELCPYCGEWHEWIPSYEYGYCNYHEQQQRQAEQSAQQKIKEDTTMGNNILNMNMEFGPNKDENIASTLMGVAVKNGDSWRIYDKKKKEITDVGDMQLGNLPIFILPTTKLSEGDLIKDAGEYYFVMKVEKESTQTLCARTGEMKNIIPIKNVLGFNCYSRVIALSDSINVGDDLDVEKMVIMSAMCGQTDEDVGQMNQLLPLMLFKDKLGGDDDKMNMVLMASMMSAPAEGGDQNTAINQLFPLMLFKDELGGDDDKMKTALMLSMMGGNMAGNNNLVMSYLMLDMLMSSKKDEQPPHQSDE